MESPHLVESKTAPKARNMIARGKRERSERVAAGNNKKSGASPERAYYVCDYFGPSGLNLFLESLSRGDALASPALAPGYLIPRLRRFWLPS